MLRSAVSVDVRTQAKGVLLGERKSIPTIVRQI